jgi:4'-phosphopantetheinyl transferase
MTPGVVVIHLIDPNTVRQGLAWACLTTEERSRADRFQFQKDSIHWIACRASLRKILGTVLQIPAHEVPLIYSEFGKPILAAPHQFLHFNLSHCPSLAAIALSIDGPVGIDLEAVERATDLLGCESGFCHPVEILNLPAELVDRSLQLLRIWTAKEAILKALGTGFSSPPELTQIIFGKNQITAFSDRSSLSIKNQQLKLLQDPRLAKYQAFVSTVCSVTEVQILPPNPDCLKNLTIDTL